MLLNFGGGGGDRQCLTGSALQEMDVQTLVENDHMQNREASICRAFCLCVLIFDPSLHAHFLLEA